MIVVRNISPTTKLAAISKLGLLRDILVCDYIAEGARTQELVWECIDIEIRNGVLIRDANFRA